MSPLALLGAVARAHEGEAHALAPREVLTWWSFEPLPGTLIVASLALYALGLRRLWRGAGRGHGIKVGEAVSAFAGFLVLAVALLSPVDKLSDIFFSVHMGQHEALMLLAAPLLVIGRPLLAMVWALPEPWRSRAGHAVQAPRFRATWRFLTAPLSVLLLHGLAIWAWHLPPFFQAALAHRWLHVIEHACFFVTAALFWWTLVHGRFGRVGYGAAAFVVFATATHSTLLGALLTLGERVLYPTHAARTLAVDVDPLADQHVAGLLMWVPAGVVLMVAGLALFAGWLAEGERRLMRKPLEPTEGEGRGAP